MRYALFSGPQGAVTNFEGGFDNTKEADEAASKLEDNGNFCHIYDLQGPGLIYSSDDEPLPEVALDSDRDYTVAVKPGQGVWVSATDDKGDTMVVRIGADRLTGMLKVGVFEPGKEDEVPVEEILVDF